MMTKKKKWTTGIGQLSIHLLKMEANPCVLSEGSRLLRLRTTIWVGDTRSNTWKKTQKHGRRKRGRAHRKLCSLIYKSQAFHHASHTRQLCDIPQSHCKQQVKKNLRWLSLDEALKLHWDLKNTSLRVLWEIRPRRPRTLSWECTDGWLQQQTAN